MANQTDFAEFAQEYIKQHPDDPELKALAVSSDPNGGYLTTPQFGGIIETYVYETSPMRRLASVIEISTDSLEYVLDNDQAGYTWVGEKSARLDTYTPQLGKLLITTGEMEAMPNVTQRMLDDSYIDIEAWVAGKGRFCFLSWGGNRLHQRRRDQQTPRHPDLSVRHFIAFRAGSAGLFRQRFGLYLHRSGRPSERPERKLPSQCVFLDPAGQQRVAARHHRRPGSPDL